MAILNRRVKKKKGNDDEDDAKENQVHFIDHLFSFTNIFFK